MRCTHFAILAFRLNLLLCAFEPVSGYVFYAPVYLEMRKSTPRNLECVSYRSRFVYVAHGSHLALYAQNPATSFDITSCHKSHVEDESTRNFVSRSAILKGLQFLTSSVEDSMAIADLKMRAFWRNGDSVQDELNIRFSWFRAVKERFSKGARCLMVCATGPFDIEILPFICTSAALSTSKDNEMMKILRSNLQNDAMTAAIEEWRSSSTHRRIVIGCVDCSTHEFQLTSLWACSGSDLYVSDMAIHPAFQGLGLGRALLRALFDLAAREGYQNLYLHVEQNNTRAASLYASEGFVVSPDTSATAALYAALGFEPEPRNVLMTRPVMT